MNNADATIHIAESAHRDMRLDKYVCQLYPEISRARVQRLIADGLITVNGAAVKSGLKLAAGDTVSVSIPPPAPELPRPEAIPLKVIYEDEDLLVIDKPAGLTVHPAPGHPEHTLVNALLARLPRLAEMDDSLRPGIVHRLDKDTSGLLVVAKHEAARSSLVAQFKAHDVAKTYQALVKGHLSPQEGIIEAPIGRDPGNRQRMAIVEAGREARTRYKVIRYLEKYTMLEVMPETGRTHQIRVHLAAIGFPVAGDKIYGVKTPALARQFLHAGRLGFKLPSTGVYTEFEAPMPEDLERALTELV
jgi:23S rRNA pseudouridine1911/1915/1917 synthase